MRTVAETPTFQRAADKLLSAQDRSDLIAYLARYPNAGDIIPGTGGVRKLRYAYRGIGKSGAVRVIYYWFDDDCPIYALLLYGKGAQVDLTSEQKQAVKAFAETIKLAARTKR
jgi:hypothetical protein